MGGIMSVTGLPGQGPVRAGIPVADLTGGLFAAQGIMIALLEREISGEGQWVQSSLLGSMIAMMDFQAARWLMKHEIPGQAGNNHPTSIPTGVFATSDGHINIAASGATMFKRLCQRLDLMPLLTDPDYATDAARSENRDALNALIEAVTLTDTAANWVEKLNEAEIPCGPIYNMQQVFADPQVQHLGMAQTVQHATMGPIEIVGQAIKLSRTPAKLETAIGEPGADNDAILADLGYTPDAIAAMRAEGVI
jgi:formyl-CoA transferase